MSPSTAAPPDDLVRTALGNPDLQDELKRHAIASLGSMLPDRSGPVRADLADVCVQETCRRSLTRSSRFDPARASAAGWVHGILGMVLLEECRKLRKQPLQPPADDGLWDVLAERMTSPTDDGLADFLAALAPDQRRIITLRFVDELSHREIAERLGISEGYARVQLSRALGEVKRIAVEKEVGR